MISGNFCKAVFVNIGSHTFDEIAKRLYSIIEDNGKRGKVSSVVTDNRSNFVKAFNVYKQPVIEESDDDSGSNNSIDFDYDSSAENSEVESPSAISLFEILEEKNKQETVAVEGEPQEVSETEFDGENDMDIIAPSKLVLPPYFRCMSHTLNLVSTTDFEKCIKANSVYKLAYRRVISKCKAL